MAKKHHATSIEVTPFCGINLTNMLQNRNLKKTLYGHKHHIKTGIQVTLDENHVDPETGIRYPNMGYGTFEKFFRPGKVVEPEMLNDAVACYNINMNTHYTREDFLTLDLSKAPAPTADPDKLRDNDLQGDIIGFYLDPKGTAAIPNTHSLQALYIHVSDDHRFWIIDNISALPMIPVIGERVFQDLDRVEENFKLLYGVYEASMLGGSRLFTGTVSRYGDLIQLAGNYGETLHRIEITMNHTYFTEGRPDNRKDGLRATMALMMVMHGKAGTYCTRLGLLRKNLMTPNFCWNDLEQWMITIYGQGGEYNPVRLDKNLDKLWYQCCITRNREYKTNEALRTHPVADLEFTP